ncbi:MAG: hypothetical protein OTI36_08565 [Beijerinckiaceae bacterium]|nr:hypothetical protein [Beijerinckiaceae bacterium]
MAQISICLASSLKAISVTLPAATWPCMARRLPNERPFDEVAIASDHFSYIGFVEA